MSSAAPEREVEAGIDRRATGVIMNPLRALVQSAKFHAPALIMLP